MGAVLPKVLGDGWQFQHVVKTGPFTLRRLAVGKLVPLLVERENLPVGSLAVEPADSENPSPEELATEVEGAYLRVGYGIPSDITGQFVFDGRVRILRRTSGFSRDELDAANGKAVVVLDTTLDLPVSRDVYQQVLVDQPLVPGVVWYYTVFYGTPDGWAFSPKYGHARNFAYVNDASGLSRHGAFLYGLFNENTRALDRDEGGEALRKLCDVLGRVFDQLAGDRDFFDKTRSRPGEMDASRLPFVDSLLGWSTSFDLSEEFRRVESRNVASIRKTRGRVAAIQLALQTVTGWEVTVVEGRPWTLRTADFSDPIPTSQPPDWNTPTDGVWADLVDRPRQTTFDKTNPRMIFGTRTTEGRSTFLFSNRRVSESGLGWSWQNPNGLLIKLRPLSQSPKLPSVVVRKVAQLVPILTIHWATFAVAIELEDSEEVPSCDDGDRYGVHVDAKNSEAPLLLDDSSEHVHDCASFRFLHTYSPEHIQDSRLFHAGVPDTRNNRLFHAWLDTGCTVAPTPTVGPPAFLFQFELAGLLPADLDEAGVFDGPAFVPRPALNAATQVYSVRRVAGSAGATGVRFKQAGAFVQDYADRLLHTPPGDDSTSTEGFSGSPWSIGTDVEAAQVEVETGGAEDLAVYVHLQQAAGSEERRRYTLRWPLFGDMGAIDPEDLPLRFARRFRPVSSGSIKGVYVYQPVAGDSGSTSVDLRINGVSVFFGGPVNATPGSKSLFIPSVSDFPAGSILDLYLASGQLGAESLVVEVEVLDNSIPDRYVAYVPLTLEGEYTGVAVPLSIGAGFVAPRPGRVSGLSLVKGTSSASGSTVVSIYKNGSFVQSASVAGSSFGSSTATSIALVPGDLLQARITALEVGDASDLTLWLYFDEG